MRRTHPRTLLHNSSSLKKQINEKSTCSWFSTMIMKNVFEQTNPSLHPRMNAQLTDICLTFASLPSLSSFSIRSWIAFRLIPSRLINHPPLTLQSLFRLSSSSCNSALRLSRSFEITIRTREIRKFRMNTSAINFNEVMKVIFNRIYNVSTYCKCAWRMNCSHTKCAGRRQFIRYQFWEKGALALHNSHVNTATSPRVYNKL